MSADEFEQIVSEHYEQLYRFAFSLTRVEADACDLTQQAFYIWATKGHQLRDRSKVKSWLFTILHREFLKIRKRAVRFPHVELTDTNVDLPTISPEIVATLDAAQVVRLLGQIHEPFQAALSLFYLEDYTYKEIAAILAIPLGTVRSRISRGLAQLQQCILKNTATPSPRTMRESDTTPASPSNIGQRRSDRYPFGECIAAAAGNERVGAIHRPDESVEGLLRGDGVSAGEPAE